MHVHVPPHLFNDCSAHHHISDGWVLEEVHLKRQQQEQQQQQKHPAESGCCCHLHTALQSQYLLAHNPLLLIAENGNAVAAFHSTFALSGLMHIDKREHWVEHSCAYETSVPVGRSTVCCHHCWRQACHAASLLANCMHNSCQTRHSVTPEWLACVQAA